MGPRRKGRTRRSAFPTPSSRLSQVSRQLFNGFDHGAEPGRSSECEGVGRATAVDSNGAHARVESATQFITTAIAAVQRLVCGHPERASDVRKETLVWLRGSCEATEDGGVHDRGEEAGWPGGGDLRAGVAQDAEPQSLAPHGDQRADYQGVWHDPGTPETTQLVGNRLDRFGSPIDEPDQVHGQSQHGRQAAIVPDLPSGKKVVLDRSGVAADHASKPGSRVGLVRGCGRRDEGAKQIEYNRSHGLSVRGVDPGELAADLEVEEVARMAVQLLFDHSCERLAGLVDAERDLVLAALGLDHESQAVLFGYIPVALGEAKRLHHLDHGLIKIRNSREALDLAE